MRVMENENYLRMHDAGNGNRDIGIFVNGDSVDFTIYFGDVHVGVNLKRNDVAQITSWLNRWAMTNREPEP